MVALAIEYVGEIIDVEVEVEGEGEVGSAAALDAEARVASTIVWVPVQQETFLVRIEVTSVENFAAGAVDSISSKSKRFLFQSAWREMVAIWRRSFHSSKWERGHAHRLTWKFHVPRGQARQLDVDCVQFGTSAVCATHQI